MKKSHVNLTAQEKDHLQDLLSKGSLSAKKYNRVLALLELDKGKTYVEVASIVSRKYTTISTWVKKYNASGLEFIEDKPRSGRPKGIDELTQAKIVALASTDAPKGYAKWSVRLLAKKVVELGYCDKISKTTISEILKKTT